MAYRFVRSGIWSKGRSFHLVDAVTEGTRQVKDQKIYTRLVGQAGTRLGSRRPCPALGGCLGG
jgi:hypothetical protein